jgi:hypothetical protein
MHRVTNPRPDHHHSIKSRATAEVIQPEDAGAGFRDVGALAGPKAALREAVQLPLQHPALFARGPLARPCRGVLLFGPPGALRPVTAQQRPMAHVSNAEQHTSPPACTHHADGRGVLAHPACSHRLLGLPVHRDRQDAAGAGGGRGVWRGLPRHLAVHPRLQVVRASCALVDSGVLLCPARCGEQHCAAVAQQYTDHM